MSEAQGVVADMAKRGRQMSFVRYASLLPYHTARLSAQSDGRQWQTDTKTEVSRSPQRDVLGIPTFWLRGRRCTITGASFFNVFDAVVRRSAVLHNSCKGRSFLAASMTGTVQRSPTVAPADEGQMSLARSEVGLRSLIGLKPPLARLLFSFPGVLIL